MTIKLKPQPFGKFQITDDAIKNVENNLKSGDPKVLPPFLKKGKSHASVIINPIEKACYVTIPVFHNEKALWSILHLPPLLYFNLCIDNINITENIIEYFYKNNKESQSDLIQIPEEYYNAIMSYKIAAIIFLHTAIDSTMNYIVPSDYRYFSKRKGKEIGKEEIEDLEFMHKVKEIFRNLFHYNICDDKAYKMIDEVNKHRTNFIHLNTTNDEKGSQKFFEEIAYAINIDLSEHVITIINLFKKFKPELFEEVDSLNHSILSQGKEHPFTLYYPIVNFMKREDFIK